MPTNHSAKRFNATPVASPIQKKNVNKEFLEISATAGDLTNLQTILLSGGSCLAHTFTSLVLTIGSCWCAMPTCHCAHSHKQTDRQKPFVLKSPRLNQHFVMIWAASEYIHLLNVCMVPISAFAGHLPSLHPSLSEHVQVGCDLSNHSEELVGRLSNAKS